MLHTPLLLSENASYLITVFIITFFLFLFKLLVEEEYEDCEAGPRDLEVTEDEAKQVIGLMKNGAVTGKENALGVTGGVTTLYFTDRSGGALGSITLYNGLLVRSDGMYCLQNNLP